MADNSMDLSAHDVTKDVKQPGDNDLIGRGGYGSVFQSEMNGRGAVALKKLESTHDPVEFARVSEMEFNRKSSYRSSMLS